MKTWIKVITLGALAGLAVNGLLKKYRKSLKINPYYKTTKEVK